MSYIAALEEAGATVLDSEYFGSYQGDILAKVEYESLIGFVRIGYGSCSGCDWYEAEVGYNMPESQRKKVERSIGESILEEISTAEALLVDLHKQAEWDYEAKDMIAWIEERIDS